MEMIDHPRLADCPTPFRVAVARLMLVWFWASWDAAGDEQRERKANDRPAQQNDGYGFTGAHAVTGAAGSGIQ